MPADNRKSCENEISCHCHRAGSEVVSSGQRNPAVTSDHRGHALADLGLHLESRQQQANVMGAGVDKTGRCDPAGQVDRLLAAGAREAADARDAEKKSKF
jgi:hypothetical protein